MGEKGRNETIINPLERDIKNVHRQDDPPNPLDAPACRRGTRHAKPSRGNQCARGAAVPGFERAR